MSESGWTMADVGRHVPRIIAERDAALADRDRWKAEADQMRSERDAYRNDRDWFEKGLRERTIELRAALAESSRLREALAAIPHEDWCCGNGCTGTVGCEGGEANCRCLVGSVRAALSSSSPGETP